MTQDAWSGSRARWIAGGLLVLAFLAGALGGVAADRLLASRPDESAATPAPPRGAGPRPGTIFPGGAALSRELALTPTQRRQIQTILAEERVKADSVLRVVRPILQARYDSSTQAIRDVLTPQQRERFDRMRDERRERLRDRRPRRGALPGLR